MRLKSLVNYLVLSIPLIIASFLFILTRSDHFQKSSSELSYAITLDFLITIPLVYALIIWKGGIPKFTILSIFILCLLVASYVIPENEQELLDQVKYIAIPVLEIGIFSFLIYKIRSISKSISENGLASLDFYDKLKMACQSTFPGRVGKLFCTEIAVMRYALFPLKKVAIMPNEFSYYKKSGIKSIIAVLIGLVLVEVIVVHLIVAQSSEKIAWILTAVGLYALIQVLSLLRSMNHRPITINYEEKILELRYGFFAETAIPFSWITELEINKKSLAESKSVIKLSPLDLVDTHNIILKLDRTHILHKIYGIEKEYKSIAVFIDEKED